MSAIPGFNPTETFGPLMVSLFFNIWLFGLEVVPFINYFANKRSAPGWLQAILVVLMALDLLAIVGAMVGSWMIFVHSFGNPVGLTSAIAWVQPIYATTDTIGACLCQCVLSWRVYKLTSSYFSGGLVLGSLATLGVGLSSILTGNNSIGTPSFTLRLQLWMGLSAGMDTIINVTLLVVLWRARQQVTRFSQSRLSTPLLKIMLRTIESGTATTFVAVTGLILCVRWPDSTRYLAALFPLGRVYTLTIFLTIMANSNSSAATGTSHSLSGGYAPGANDSVNKSRRFAGGDISQAQQTVSINLQQFNQDKQQEQLKQGDGF